MNEIALSNDLNQIELEINYHKQIAGNSIWEIGRRLNHVKENDLAHGEFMNWLEEIGVEHTSAKRMMKISKELPKSATLHHLGESALYLISTLPTAQQEEELNKAEKGNSSTVKELQEVKRQNKEKDQTINELNEMVENQKPEIVEKEVIKEVKPHDYEGLKGDNKELSNMVKQAQSEAKAAKDRNDFIEGQYQQLLKERENVDEKSRKYDELTENIQKLEGKMNDAQKRISSYKNITDTIRKGNKLIDEVAGLVYLNDYELMENETVSKEVKNLVQRINRLGNDLNKKINETNIIEGTVINE